MKLKILALSLIFCTFSAHAFVVEGILAAYFAIAAVIAGKETYEARQNDKGFMDKVVQEMEKNVSIQKFLPHADKLKGWLEKMGLIKDPAWHDFKYWYYRARAWNVQYKNTLYYGAVTAGATLLSLYFLKEVFGKAKKEVQHIEIATSEHSHHHPIA